MKELSYFFSGHRNSIYSNRITKLQKLINKEGLYSVLKKLKKVNSGDEYLDEQIGRFNSAAENIEFALEKIDIELQ